MAGRADEGAPPVAEAQRAKDVRPWWEKRLTWVTTPLILVLFLLGWSLYVDWTGLSRFVLPKPGAIFKALLDLLHAPFFWTAFRVTVTEILIGFALAVALGAALGIGLGKSRIAERIAGPFVVFSQVTPKVALMPLFLLWLGFGMQSKIAIVVLLSFFPIMKSTMLGVRSIGEDQRALFTVIRASRWKRIVSLEIPAVLPYLLTGIETASVLAVTGAIVGEYLGGNEGLGALVVQTLQSLQVEAMFATIMALAIFGFLFYGAISAVRRLAVPWHESAAFEE
ncbi:MAG: ABC transporter permease [Alphaproteobacteria bacterium]|nr:ABC transporter permease [Alphaproteobacteria bacterium]